MNAVGYLLIFQHVGQAPINILCLKDCVDMLNHLLDRKLKVQSNDLIGFFKQAGQTYEEVRDFMNRESMAFYTANTIVNGQLDVTTPILKIPWINGNFKTPRSFQNARNKYFSSI